MPIDFIGGFESTYLPHHDRDVMETTAHDVRWRDDLALLADTGVWRARYPIRWHRIERAPGRFDWSATDVVLAHMRDTGMRPIVDLVHHTSYPRWLTDGFGDRRFPEAYLRYVEAFFDRYGWVEEYTLLNEPFATLFLCGHEGIWPPYSRGAQGLVTLLGNVLPALAEAARLGRRMVPAGTHVWVDSCEHHTGTDAGGRRYATFANDRRFFVLDAILGRVGDVSTRPFVQEVVRAGGEGLLDIEPAPVDVLGLDYYPHCQWSFGGGTGTVPTFAPMPLNEQILLYAKRYGLPCLLSETNLRGAPSDRATWLKYTLEQCELAAARGVDMRGYCWFPFVDSTDWGSLLNRCEGSIDPVGVYALDADGERRPGSMSAAYRLAAHGTPAADLPAYRLQRPVSDWLAGYLPQMAHWEWVPPPASEVAPDPVLYEMELRICAAR